MTPAGTTAAEARARGLDVPSDVPDHAWLEYETSYEAVGGVVDLCSKTRPVWRWTSLGAATGVA